MPRIRPSWRRLAGLHILPTHSIHGPSHRIDRADCGMQFFIIRRVPGRGELLSLLQLLRALATVQSLFAIMLAFLFALAVRRRFQIS